MGYKVKGEIVSIGEKKVLDNEAVVLDYVVNHTSDNGFVTPMAFNMYKAKDYAEHVDNFIEYNKVGDIVEVEFNIRGKEYNGRIYNSLSHWRCDKVVKEVKQENVLETDMPF
ncbi:MAG: hypothetical protein Unbinned3907contig1000_37 [Prokaryotic dsDNA virus sp.]|nr:MAG: hypothetical protein Unbinned3907contig1000_37 [Prokaryotic dsDNA virus sp.]|tara:strand:- start:5285 stop:5620 length:336 start_codon:yes stop_codon:yes gene_type:complete